VPLVAVLVPPSTPRPEAAPALPAPKERRPSRRKAKEAAAAPRAVQPAPPAVPAVIDAPPVGEAPPAPPPVKAAEQSEGPPAAATASEPPVVASSAPVFDALYLENPRPAYPMLSRRLREQGRVLLRVLVSLEGRATQVQIQGSSGYERLDAAAREAVARWRFVPAQRGEERVDAWVLIPITFSLPPG